MSESAAQPRYYQAIIKVNPTDAPERQRSDIIDGLSYACVLLMDEHGMRADAIVQVIERIADELYDAEAQRV